jgi:hypothetical protein
VPVLCDACQSDPTFAAHATEQGVRHATSRYICGPRYKSASKRDFDLCGACEARGSFQTSHGPFLKICHPREAPGSILCVPEVVKGKSLSLFDHLDVDDHPGLVREVAEFVAFRKLNRNEAKTVGLCVCDGVISVVRSLFGVKSSLRWCSKQTELKYLGSVNTEPVFR